MGVAPNSAPRLVRPGDAVSVALAGPYPRNEAVPDAVLLLEGQLDLDAGRIEEAE